MAKDQSSMIDSKKMTNPIAPDGKTPSGITKAVTGALILSDGTVFWGQGVGKIGSAVGEVCFNTSLTGYQEILTDPSYAGQIINFTFPHIGNVGANKDDHESDSPAALGFVIHDEISDQANYRAESHFNDWAAVNNLVGISGIDTRTLTNYIRKNGAPNGIIVNAPDGVFDVDALLAEANNWPGLEGMDLAKEVSCTENFTWTQGPWDLENGYISETNHKFHVVAVDYGIKRNILRCLVNIGAKITVVPCTASADDILALSPDGVFLSNGPGDPAATGIYAIAEIEALIASSTPIFGICLGHQLLALAAGGKTYKMYQGHRGANHPVKDFNTNKVEITSMNHGFSVDADSLPDNVEVSHISLFDKTVCGLQWKDKPIFSVQHHPEASPGPQDSHYLFTRFANMMSKDMESN
jgi:carbamoyl-phosphate synthase small subunit